MLKRSEQRPFSFGGIVTFILRNLVLVSLIANAYLHFREELDLVFVISSYAIAVILAVWMERTRLKLLAAVLITAASIVAL
jgi:hypothetical protein